MTIYSVVMVPPLFSLITFLISSIDIRLLGNLCIEEAPRKLIHSSVLEIFDYYFPDTLKFKSSDPPCELCTVIIEDFTGICLSWFLICLFTVFRE